MCSFHPRPALARFVTILALATGTACSSRDSKAVAEPGAVLTIVSAADADALIPPIVSTTQGKQVVDQLFDHLAEPDSSLETVGDAGFRPQLATGWRWSADSLSIAFTIDPRARWHVGTARVACRSRGRRFEGCFEGRIGRRLHSG